LVVELNAVLLLVSLLAVCTISVDIKER